MGRDMGQLMGYVPQQERGSAPDLGVDVEREGRVAIGGGRVELHAPHATPRVLHHGHQRRYGHQFPDDGVRLLGQCPVLAERPQLLDEIAHHRVEPVRGDGLGRLLGLTGRHAKVEVRVLPLAHHVVDLGQQIPEDRLGIQLSLRRVGLLAEPLGAPDPRPSVGLVGDVVAARSDDVLEGEQPGALSGVRQGVERLERLVHPDDLGAAAQPGGRRALLELVLGHHPGHHDHPRDDSVARSALQCPGGARTTAVPRRRHMRRAVCLPGDFMGTHGLTLGGPEPRAPGAEGHGGGNTPCPHPLTGRPSRSRRHSRDRSVDQVEVAQVE
jgi:hypothetical protein